MLSCTPTGIDCRNLDPGDIKLRKWATKGSGEPSFAKAKGAVEDVDGGAGINVG